MSNPDILPLEALVIGARFVRVGAPHVVYVKQAHNWASLNWKGRRTDVPMHHSTLVRHAPAGQVNPGEAQA